MGLKNIKMKWDLCSSPPCIPFYPYTMFHNPMPKPFCQKFRETLITQKVLVTQSSNILHCNWHIQKPICADFQAFSNTFSMFKLTFFFSFFVKGSSVNNQKVHILLILTGKNASKWLQWCIFRVQGVPIPMAQVSSLYNKWFLKNHKFRQKSHFVDFDWNKMHQNDLSGTYLGCEVCQIQWCRCLVSIINGSWKIKNSGRNFTFCWFWLGKVHWNGLGGAY